MHSPSLGHFLLILAFVAPACAADPVVANGWRGNGTGIWSDARPPIDWVRIPHGALDGMRITAERVADGKPDSASLVEKGLLREWLVIGPFPAKDSIKDFDTDFLGGEANAEPAAGQSVADHAWKPLTAPPDDIHVFGAAEPPFLDLAKVVGFEKNQFAYAHTWLHSPRGGPARLVIDHCYGLKVWLNGRQMYREPKREFQLGAYPQLSRFELSHTEGRSPKIEFSLQPGWNRLMLKLSTPGQEGWTEMRCSLRLMDPPDVSYENRNIAWMTPLPARSTSTPILVGDRLFVFCEPDELVCLDKNSGAVKWSAFINDYEALDPAVKQSNAGYAEKVDPLITALRHETVRAERTKLRRQIREQLEAIDKERFHIVADGHFEAHFSIVGFTMPTPVSDGRNVFVWSGMGVAACFDLDGKRRWITRPPARELSYGSSPALAGGILAVFLGEAFGLDAATGEMRWRQPRLNKNIGSLLAATLGDQQVFVSQRGDVLRANDGEFLFRPPGSQSAGDAGWCPPQILGQLMYLPRYGITQMLVFDFTGTSGDNLAPRKVAEFSLPDHIHRGADGKWIDRMTPGSPLVWEGINYACDIYQMLAALDLKTGKLVHWEPLPLDGLMHYNAVPVAASPALIGGHIYIMDNQGTTIVIEPGPECKIVARNRLATQLDRTLPIPAQETIAYAPPITDGKRLFIRGEAFLYCIGEK